MKFRLLNACPAPVRTIVVAVAVVSAALPIVAQTQEQSAREIYRQDRADCMAGRTNQSQADCLYEARSALRDRRNGDPELTDATDPVTTDNPSQTMASSAAPSDGGETLPPQADRN